jgi:hypothetical protein
MPASLRQAYLARTVDADSFSLPNGGDHADFSTFPQAEIDLLGDASVGSLQEFCP